MVFEYVETALLFSTCATVGDFESRQFRRHQLDTLMINTVPERCIVRNRLLARYRNPETSDVERDASAATSRYA